MSLQNIINSSALGTSELIRLIVKSIKRFKKLLGVQSATYTRIKIKPVIQQLAIPRILQKVDIQNKNVKYNLQVIPRSFYSEIGRSSLRRTKIDVEFEGSCSNNNF